ncbi:3-phosphoshikimate 1-carboxyvinyltransferase [Kitasatospora sp. NPDC001175]|uniref:3-phosphoshikimate 1-carboxyvinyltransferase n=1 Tax=Kitasatospora sp. NPDC001175 TaxID=3157103 RepID=UPI003CFCB77F
MTVPDDRYAGLLDQARALPERILVRSVHPAEAGGPALQPHPDKAISQRATVLAAVADGTSRLSNVADCADVRCNLRALEKLGIQVRVTGPGELMVTGTAASGIRITDRTLDAGNSATTSRLLLAVLAGSTSDCVVTGNRLLRSRPMTEVLDPLRELGAEIEELGEPGRLPLRVRGARLRGGEVNVTVDSAQPVSALQFAALNAAGPVRIRRRTMARDHTERLLRWTGVPVAQSELDLLVTPRRPRAFDLTVPGDPSGAALLAALHLASAQPGQELTLTRVGLNPLRTGFLRILAAMGATVTETVTSQDGPEPAGDIRIVLPGPLRGTVVEGRQLVQSAIDELPLVAALAAVAKGRTVIRDAAELKGKDTDRIASTVELLAAFGIAARATPDGLMVEPGTPVAPEQLRLPADHRVIFAAFVLALLAGGGCELSGVRAAATSHPGAIDDLARFARLEIR